jgi:hypothetical protein
MDGIFGEPSATRRSVVFKRYQTDLSANFSTDVDLPGVGIAYKTAIPGEKEGMLDLYKITDSYGSWDTYKEHLNEYRMDSIKSSTDRDMKRLLLDIHTQDPHLRKLVLQENFEV